MPLTPFRIRVVGALVAPFLLAGFLFVAALAQPAPQGSALLQTLASPAGPGSGMYSMFGAGPDAYLSWLEPVSGRTQALKFSLLGPHGWSPAREIARSDNWFVNWADHPSVIALPDGTLAAHWLANNGREKAAYGYGFRIAISKDRGHTWREVYAGGTRNQGEDYSGFVSLLPGPDGFTAVYLGPPREQSHASHGEHTMTLGSVRFDGEGRVLDEVVADANTCSCCSTSIVQVGTGVLVAYRDRTDDEIRDISVVSLRDGRWSAPRTVHDDRWRINACPTNGPVLSAVGRRVAVAWFTGAGDVGHVKAAFSSDGGQTFTTPAVVDGGRPVGWPSTVLLDDGSTLVSWLESRGEGRGEIRVRRVSPTGALGDPLVVADASPGRTTGIPYMVRHGDAVLLAWRNERVMTARLPIAAVPPTARPASR